MKRIFVIFTCSLLLFFACKDKSVDPVYPAESQLKKIEIIDYGNEDTTSIDIAYNTDGLVSTVSINKAASPDGPFSPSSYSLGKAVEYDGNRIRKISTNGTIDSPSGATITYMIIEDFEYTSGNTVKSYSEFYSQGGVISESTTDLDFHTDDEGNLLYLVKTTNNHVFTAVDTFLYVVSPADGSRSFLEADSLPEDQYTCDFYNIEYWFKQNGGFEYSYSGRCNTISASSGNYSSLKNNLSKPVWDVLTGLVSGLEPIYGEMSIAFYSSRLVPEYFITSTQNAEGTDISSYEYITDYAGRILSIKESRTGAGDTRFIRFYYENE